MSTANEKRIIRATVDALLADGYRLSVNDGGAITVSDSTDPRAIVAAMMTTDEDWLLANGGTKKSGWVRFIYGNGNNGADVIADHTTNLEPSIRRVEALCASLER